ncbi:MAG TPA: hypothetical protein VGC67_14215 [Cellulomonas sp.]
MPATFPTGGPPELPGDLLDALRERADPSAARPLTVVVAAGGDRVVAALTALGGPDLRVLTGSAPAASPVTGLRQDVLAHSADLALLPDPDGDRCTVLDENGEPVDPAVVVALVALPEAARVRGTGAVVAQDVLVSRVLTDLLAATGARTERVATGRAALAAAAGRPGTVLAVGHDGLVLAPPADGVPLPGDLLTALHVVAALGAQPHPLSVLAELHQASVTSGEIVVPVADPNAARERVVEAYVERRGAGAVGTDDLDGLTVSHWGQPPPWWFHLRADAAGLVVRLHVEAADEDIMEKVRDDVLDLVRLED